MMELSTAQMNNALAPAFVVWKRAMKEITELLYSCV